MADSSNKDNGSGVQESRENDENKIDSAGPQENDDRTKDADKTGVTSNTSQGTEAKSRASPVPGMQATSGPLQDYYQQ